MFAIFKSLQKYVKKLAHLIEGNDPYKEHDFGSFDYKGNKIFFKIDYYDRFNTHFASENPADISKTLRILTILLAEEY